MFKTLCIIYYCMLTTTGKVKVLEAWDELTSMYNDTEKTSSKESMHYEGR